ncbi:3-oxoacyl-ACP synthase III [Acanthopleuribacter pedis]|uniref:3-oxoacyl-ACP synthase III n=1 Tax=Acanthopleuribacter pedis TaxID=442870 RepID=A0A8J7U3A4_9BACT|nr:3-oxoacyl-ACP synthase III [Acanthopleuribacter pedis]MBO1317247.1 3-oxoacyl-ACP synthase III [Acanthopleuribacter pedis]MBO1318554.1 3-oxoacyl-ACP synthase III [Acanthopleuribacter pedis]
MKYSRVYVDSIRYVLPPVIVSSRELEARLRPVYKALHISMGQLEVLTGVQERRWWKDDDSLSDRGAEAAKRALDAAGIDAADLGALVYTGVCREQFEPATACMIASHLGISQEASVFDLSNACLGALNGILDIANRIELGQIRAGMVVSCETSREINETMIKRMLEDHDMELFKMGLATLTGGSGAVAILLTDGSFAHKPRRRLVGGVTLTDPRFHDLCHWGLEQVGADWFRPMMSTDSVAVLKHGVALGLKTWKAFLKRLDWTVDLVDKVICHQVGSEHQNAILKFLGIPNNKDYVTYPFLGNIGTVSVPITAAIAEEREFLKEGDRVSFLGIGSGLNCTMLGFQW